MGLPGNDVCFDCQTNCSGDPWASLSHGTIICLQCAGMHRGLGVHVSFVRSLGLDALKRPEWRTLRRSGNLRFSAFLEEQEVSMSTWTLRTFKDRYNSPVADLYRRRLLAQQRGDELPTDLKPTCDFEPSSCSRIPVYATDDDEDGGQIIWTQDDMVKRCELCRCTFSVFRRRHHCRGCGRCICNRCSPKSGWKVTSRRGRPARHCKVCSPPAARTIAGLS